MKTKTTSIAAIAILGVTGAIFTAIASRFLIDPAASLTAQGLAVKTSFGLTTMRVGFGVFPLGFALVAFTGLLSPSRRLDALRFVAGVFTLALAVRIGSVVADHAAGAANTRLIAIEAVILALALTTLALDRSLRNA